MAAAPTPSSDRAPGRNNHDAAGTAANSSGVVDTGILLINVGSPDAPTTPALRRYLRQFLSDPRVIDLHPVARWLLVNLIILPTRPAKSAEAYRAIWTPEGSPLLTHSRAVATALQNLMPQSVKVAIGMAYGSPSVDTALTQLEQAGVERIVVIPMFPQYASATTGSVVEAVCRKIAARDTTIPFEIRHTFYDHPDYIRALAATTAPHLQAFAPDHVLFSYHGLPERHVARSHQDGFTCPSLAPKTGGSERTASGAPSRACGPCPAVQPANRWCYRAHCYTTTNLVRPHLGLDDKNSSVSFQSRLGRTPWVQPYTDDALPQLAQAGVKRLAVVCPSFVADCLETLEEIGLRAKEQWMELGGEAFALVPCLNDHPDWVAALKTIALAPAPATLNQTDN